MPKRDNALQQNGSSQPVGKGQHKLTPTTSQVASLAGTAPASNLKDSRQGNSVTGVVSHLGGGGDVNVSWFTEEPSSAIKSLNNLTDVVKCSSQHQRKPKVKMDTSAILSSHFSDLALLSFEKKKEENELGPPLVTTPTLPTMPRLTTVVESSPHHPSDAPSSRSSVKTTSTGVFPAGGLATASTQGGVREKRPFPAPTLPANHQKSSPNGIHDGRKLSMEQELKQALTSG